MPSVPPVPRYCRRSGAPGAASGLCASPPPPPSEGRACARIGGETTAGAAVPAADGLAGSGSRPRPRRRRRSRAGWRHHARSKRPRPRHRFRRFRRRR